MRKRLGYLSNSPNVRLGVARKCNKLSCGGQVVLSEGVPELNWPNVPQAEPCLTTKSYYCASSWALPDH